MITLKNVVLRRSAKLLLDGANATINPGERVGLVGRNGAGKSTLFALFNRTLHEDGGDFFLPKQWRMSQVAQDMPETDEGASAFVVGGDTRLVELREALAKIEAAYTENPDDADLGMALAHAYTDLADAGEHDAVPRAQALILGLGFKSHELDAPVSSFSGGWRMRLQLARALMCPSDLLLLDEPTNHLDLDALVWLEAWLQKYEGTMIVISHDREFLDAVTNVTLHVANAQLTRYGGNYSKFEEMRALQMEQQQAAFGKQQEKIAHLQKFIDRFKAKASKAKQAQSRVKALERMEKVAPLLAEADFTFEFKEPGNIPNPMLSITQASFGYMVDDVPKTILTNVSKSVQAGQRIGILGANGQGKSTLVKTIAREMGALAGTVTEGKGLNIGYFAQQELDVLRPQDNPLEHMVRMARELGTAAKEPTGEQALRGFLGSFNFNGDMVKQPVGTMSGGEKARLVLAMMVWQRPNLLLLDEPTNHLDLATREALAVALNEFEGTLMLVSHDRALLRSVCDEFWMVGRGGVTDFDGDLDDYQRYLLDEAKRLREEAKEAVRKASEPVAAPAPAVAAKQDAAQGRQQRSEQARPLKREIAQIDERLAEAGTAKAAIEARLAQALPAAEIAEAGKRLKALNEEIERLEERWMTVSGQLEALTA
ncbi:ABC-F family ATP-binding cassette domain-containing protein [Variovorax arabinosiphilus]|uniref:ABC-F family ATP-binding cassette domain-containing protein n=1 Tax=Variovorax arabinosiphilus TaxID=3053498 RepID=UPI002574E1EC|nr:MULTISPECIES: ATP-binding cassette domain-containing protein [unclassified Variovorax]MDM0118874.1 ATP-binding cassette domain-containing protein [Variovorax sp. J2L1-78]MDM0129299.1 ATP-binding cassette domain-containing protein [Variovorax sp. J2L1-63]MDM0232914.1 ATP-binding cassette domain-containing protein [Variovorax sp. J2R1-6]